MPQTLIPVTYTDLHGKTQTTSIVRGQPVTRRLENFCRLVASGEHDPIDAYCQAYSKEFNPTTALRCSNMASNLMGRTDVILRIQQLRTPVMPKIAQKYEYNINIAMHELQTAMDLAYAQGHVPSMLKVIELRARLHKMLSEQIDVTHKHGFLDDTATEVLLEMKKRLEGMRKETLKLPPPTVTVESTE